MTKTIDLVVGPEVITSYRRLAYTPWHAIAEFVDNSTQSYFNNRPELDDQMEKEEDQILTVTVAYGRKEGSLRVSDNAMGMSFPELERALHIALPPANTDGRSKYGMGMKTAACWMGNQWVITTKKLGEDQEHTVVVDVAKVAKSEQDAVVYTSNPKCRNLHYTMVSIEQMNRTFRGRTLGKIGDFLRSMYRSDLQNQVLKLFWQSEELIWHSVESRLLVSKDGKKYKEKFEFDIDGKTVHGWVGILGKGSRADAGFSILQSDRVVMGWPDAWRPQTLYGQFQGSNDLVNQRLVGEIHLDGFEVSHTKDSILWRDNQEDEVEEKLEEHCRGYKDFAKKRRKNSDDERRPKDLDVEAALEDIKKELSSPEMVDQIDISIIPPDEIIIANNEKIIDSVLSTRDATLAGTIASSTMIIDWKIFLESMSPNDPYVISDSTKATEINVIVNTNHPYWNTQLQETESVTDYLRQCIYDSVAEWQARTKASTIEPDTVKLLKDKLLRVPLEIEAHGVESETATIELANQNGRN